VSRARAITAVHLIQFTVDWLMMMRCRRASRALSNEVTI
jgi:hypothetical protein